MPSGDLPPPPLPVEHVHVGASAASAQAKKRPAPSSKSDGGGTKQARTEWSYPSTSWWGTSSWDTSSWDDGDEGWDTRVDWDTWGTWEAGADKVVPKDNDDAYKGCKNSGGGKGGIPDID